MSHISPAPAGTFSLDTTYDRNRREGTEPSYMGPPAMSEKVWTVIGSLDTEEVTMDVVAAATAEEAWTIVARSYEDSPKQYWLWSATIPGPTAEPLICDPAFFKYTDHRTEA